MRFIWIFLLLFIHPAFAQFASGGGSIISGCVPSGTSLLQANGLSGCVSATTLSTINGQFYNDTGLQARYLLTEGTGTTINDSSGNNNTINFSGLTNPPTWTTGGLLFNAFGLSTIQPINLPTSITNSQTVEFAFTSAANNSQTLGGSPAPVYNGLGGYGCPTATSCGLTVSDDFYLATQYNGAASTFASNSTQMGYATIIPSFYQTTGARLGTMGSIDNGFHVLAFQRNFTSPYTMSVYLDGVFLAQNHSGTAIAPATGGGVYQFGGTYQTGTALSQMGFAGTIVGASFSSTALNAAQISQDASAWKALALYKGVVNVPTFPYTSALQGINYNCGESIAGGNALTNVATQNYTVLAATILSSDLGITVTPRPMGVNTNTGYSMSVSNWCQNTLLNDSYGAVLKIVVIQDNANDARIIAGYNSYGANIWPLPVAQTVTGQVLADIKAEGIIAQTLKAQGWIVFAGVPMSAQSTTDDQAIKDVAGPLWRAYAIQAGFSGLIDFTDDPRLGADNAAGSGTTGTACNSTGTAGPSWANNEHPNQCGSAIMANMEVSDYFNYVNGLNPQIVSTSSTTYTIPQIDIGDRFSFSGAAAAITLPSCTGIFPSNGRAVFTLENFGTSSDTVAPGFGWEGGAQETINGSASNYILTSGAKIDFYLTRGTDAAGNCGWTTY